MFVNENSKEDLYQYIIKRHSYYEAKIDVIDEKLNVDLNNKFDLNSTNTTTNSSSNSTNMTEEERIENLIKTSKNHIETLKNKMINEERYLLGLYKLKRNK